MTSGGNVVLLPTLAESTELHELSHNLEETEGYIDELTKDKDKLQDIYHDCQTKLTAEFEELRKTLNAREQAMMASLDKSYEDRDNKLARQLQALENHKEKNEETLEKSKNTIATVDNKGKTSRLAREKTIRDYCQDCIDDSPAIDKVPIKLYHTFDKKKHISDELVKFSVLRFDRIESGKHLPFTRLNAKIVNNKRKVGTKITPDQVPLMTISGLSMKYNKKSDQLTVEIRCKDAKIDVGDSKEEAENMLQAYNEVKTNKTYVHIELRGNEDDEETTVHYCQKISSLQQSMKSKYTLFVDKKFDTGSTVYVRARIAHLADSSVVDDDGYLDESDAIKLSQWTGEKKAVFGKVVSNNVGVGEGPGSPSNYNNNNNYNAVDANDFGGINMGEEQELDDDNYNDNDNNDDKNNGNNGNVNINISQLTKIKIQGGMTIAGKEVTKKWTFQNKEKKREFTFQALEEKTRKFLKLKKVPNFEDKILSFSVGQNTVATQQDFEDYCVNAPDPEQIEMAISYT